MAPLTTLDPGDTRSDEELPDPAQEDRDAVWAAAAVLGSTPAARSAALLALDETDAEVATVIDEMSRA